MRSGSLSPTVQGVAASGWRPARSLGLASQRTFVSRPAAALVAVLFGALIIGDRPFAPDQADKAALVASGNTFNRLVIFASFGLALLLVLPFLERALRLACRNWPVGAMVLWSGLSVLWASHPDLTLRRAFAMALVYSVLLALAASLRRPKDFLVPLAAVFALVTVLNLTAMVAFPAASWSPIGETGIFDNKNSAGTMAMLAIVGLGSAVPLVGSRSSRVLAVGALALAWLFLLATRSKTSIGLGAMIAVLGPALFVVLGWRADRRLAVGAGVAAALLLGLTAFAGLGYDDEDFRLLLFGDLTFTGRTEIWQPVIQEIGRRPWLGAGFGSFWDIGALVNPLSSAPPSAWFMNAQLINTSHSGYLDVLLQTGVVGFALTILAIARTSWRFLAEAAILAPAGRIVPVAAFCLVLCIVLNNFLESYLFRAGDTVGYLFIFLTLLASRMELERFATAGAAPAAES